MKTEIEKMMLQVREDTLREVMEKIEGIKFKQSHLSLRINDCPNCDQEVNRDFIDDLTVRIKEECRSEIKSIIHSVYNKEYITMDKISEKEIEKIINKVRMVEFLHGVPVNLPSETVELLRSGIRSAILSEREKFIEDINKKMDEYEHHKDEVHCTCLGALREYINQTNI